VTSAPSPADSGGRRGAAAVAGGLAVALLLVVAGASSADRLVTSRAPERLGLPRPLTLGLSSLGAVAVILAIELVLAALVYGRLFVSWSRPGAEGRRLGGWRRLVESLGPFVFVLSVVGLVILLHQVARVRAHPPPAGGAPGLARGAHRLTLGSGRAGFLSWGDAALIATVVAALVILVGAIVLIRRVRRPSRVGEEGDPVRAGGRSLLPPRHRAPRTPREAVWCALADLEERVAAAGAGRRAHEGPQAFLGRAVPTPPGPDAPAAQLVDLYHRARFSPHPVDDGAARSARAAAHQLGSRLHRERGPGDG